MSRSTEIRVHTGNSKYPSLSMEIGAYTFGLELANFSDCSHLLMTMKLEDFIKTHGHNLSKSEWYKTVLNMLKAIQTGDNKDYNFFHYIEISELKG